MITDKDIKKLEKTFVTKDDLQRLSDQLIDLISGGFSRFDKYFKKVDKHDDDLIEHGRRLTKLEAKMYA